MGINESDNMSPKLALDQQIPENETMNVSSETLDAGTGNVSSGLESGPAQEAAEVYVPTSNVSDLTQIPNSPSTKGLLMQEGFMGFMMLFLFTLESGSFSGVFL